jgi:hypothetical protein
MHYYLAKTSSHAMKNAITNLLLTGALLASACSGDSGKSSKVTDAATFMDTGKAKDVIAADVPISGNEAGKADTADAVGEVAGEVASASGEVATEAAVASCIGGAEDLLADFSVDNSLSPVGGRKGGFYVYGDESTTGQFDPPNVSGKPYPIDKANGNPHCSGPGSFHLKATGWGNWGAALGVDLVARPSELIDGGTPVDSHDGGPGAIAVDADGTVAAPQGPKGTYDASKYKGISFWAKASKPLIGVQVSFPDAYSDAAASFAGLPDMKDASFTSCVYIQDPRYNCSPYLVKFGADNEYFPSYMTYSIDTTWKRFDVYFADTRQDRYNIGFHAAANPKKETNVDLKHLTSFAIQVNAIYVGGAPTANDFEIWVDDVYFIR